MTRWPGTEPRVDIVERQPRVHDVVVIRMLSDVRIPARVVRVLEGGALMVRLRTSGATIRIESYERDRVCVCAN